MPHIDWSEVSLWGIFLIDVGRTSSAAGIGTLGGCSEKTTKTKPVTKAAFLHGLCLSYCPDVPSDGLEGTCVYYSNSKAMDAEARQGTSPPPANHLFPCGGPLHSCFF